MLAETAEEHREDTGKSCRITASITASHAFLSSMPPPQHTAHIHSTATQHSRTAHSHSTQLYAIPTRAVACSYVVPMRVGCRLLAADCWLLAD